MSETITTPSRQNWIVVVFGFLALSLAFPRRAALGLIMPAWVIELEWTSSYISSVGDRYGHRSTFCRKSGRSPQITFHTQSWHGLIGGGCAIVALMNGKLIFVIEFAGFSAIGFGIVATNVVATAVTRSFSINQGLATGIGTSGATGGQFLISPLIAALLTFASWRWSFGALSFASLALIPVSV